MPATSVLGVHLHHYSCHTTFVQQLVTPLLSTVPNVRYDWALGTNGLKLGLEIKIWVTSPSANIRRNVAIFLDYLDTIYCQVHGNSKGVCVA